MAKFTEAELVDLAHKQYGKPISLDMLEEAMKYDAIEEAAELLIIDSQYWDNFN
jgi:hypothetical protein